MDEHYENNDKTPEQIAQDGMKAVGKAAESGKHAAKAIGNLSMGNIPGAIMEILKDENFRKILMAIIVAACILVLCIIACLMMIGTSITGVVEDLSQGYADSWEENWEEQGIASNGNALYLYTQGLANAQSSALIDAIESLFINTDKADNSELEDADLTAITDDDYRTTLQAIKDQEALVGEDGALMKRINMIKGRVAQRGTQITSMATAQYSMEALGLAIGESLTAMITDPILYAGVDLENCAININTAAFEISDIQALKILAAYSIQHDCLITEVDMWDLMDYCGWYSTELTELPVSYTENTIYDSSITGTFASEIGGVVEAGDVLSSEIITLSAPQVPYWDGSCAPQWYYEEIAQLEANNNKYEQNINNENVVSAMTYYEEDSNGNVDISNFSKLAACDTYGIVDQLFTAVNASLVVSRTDYHGASEYSREAINSLSETIKAAWNKSYNTNASRYSSSGNLISRDSDNNHSYTLYTSNTHSYYIVNTTTGWTSSTYQGSTNSSLQFPDLVANTTYKVYETWTTYIHGGYILDDTGGEVMLPRKIGPGTFIQKTELVETFTTLSDAPQPQAYQLQFNITIDYEARSIDELTQELLGLWHGSLENTDSGSDGKEYAAGHVGEEHLALTWTDTYTDSSGASCVLQFQRRQGYQVEAYEDIVLALAKTLNIDASNLFTPNYGYGDSIIDMAMKEYNYYHANGLSGGMRYWNMAKEAIGWNFGYDAPWCACFVMTTAWQCGFIGEGCAWGDMGGTTWPFTCGGVWSALVNNGKAEGYNTVTCGYMPVAGDLIFFSPEVGSSNPAHIGFVVEVKSDGTLVTIEGNSGNSVKINTYSNYAIGTALYKNNGQTVRISAYAHPNYPSPYLSSPTYQSVYGTTAASTGARIVNSGDSQILLAGLTRFRWSQLPDVVAMLKENYPAVYISDLQTALDGNDMQAFVTAWNSLITTDKLDTFQNAQQSITAKLYIQPVVSAVQSNTSFNWSRTTAREEILLGILTTTDDMDAVERTLTQLCSGMSNTISDEDFLAALKKDNFLYNTVVANKNLLWTSDSEALKTSWCSGIQTLLDKLTS